MKDNIDKLIEEKVSFKNYIPKELGKVIVTTVNDQYKKEEKKYKKNQSYRKYTKLLVGLCAGVLITTGVVFAKDINNYVKTLFSLNEHGIGEQQINKAIDNNYVQINNEDYIYSNNVAYKIEHTLINNINLIFSMEFIIDEYNIKDFNNLSINGLSIKDEDGNQIYIDSEDEKIHTKNIACSMRYNKIEKEDNKVKMSIVLTAPKFPVMKKIYISFESITLYSINNGVANTKKIDGEYDLELNVNDKFNNRESKSFNVVDINDSNNIKCNIESLELTNTGLGIVVNCEEFSCLGYEYKIFNTKGEEIYSNKNDINPIGNENRYFIWLDVGDSIYKDNSFILRIKDLNGNIYECRVNK